MSSAYTPTDDAAYRKYAALQLREHTLLLAELDTENVEDEMTDLWDNLDDVQRRSLNGMGSDLIWVRRRDEPPPRGPKAEDVTEADYMELREARQLEKWHRVLHYLRVCAPRILPLANLAYLRAQAYEHIHLPEYARIFIEFAADLDPHNGKFGVCAIIAIQRSDPFRALERTEQVVASPNNYPAAVVAICVRMIVLPAKVENRAINDEYLASVLANAIERLPLEPHDTTALTVAYGAAADSFDLVGDSASALHCCEEGLKSNPNSSVLLTSKGRLLYAKDPRQAVEALEQVIRQGAYDVWPYLILAHHHLVKEEYKASLQMIAEARLRNLTNSKEAMLLEWAAICHLKLSSPEDEVRALFQRAAELDPSNARIRENCEIFETETSAKMSTVWKIDDESAVGDE